MRRKREMASCAGLILLALLLVGCKSSQATPTAVSKSLGEMYASQAFDTSYAGALNAYRQLMLGTLRLEGSENAVTPEQAKLLLVLWQSLSGRALQSDAEREAVLAYIETHMTPAQLEAIAAMRLTQADLQALLPDTNQGPGGGVGRGDSGTRFAPGRQATPPAAASTRPTQAGRATVRGTSDGLTTGSAQDTVLLNALIRLLAQKSAGGAAPSLGSRTINQTPTARQTGRQPAEASTATPGQTARLTSTVTATATFTPTGAGRAVPLATQPRTQGAPLEFTRDDIEYAPSAPRTGDRKIQLTIRLKPKGGMPPLGFLLDGTTQVDGLTFTFDWHNCGESEPHSIMILSADGQKSRPVEFIYPFACR